MLGHKRSLAALVATAALAVAALAVAAPSSTAAPYVHAPTLTVPTTAPACAAAFSVSGSGFVPGSTLHVTLQPGGFSVGSVVVNAHGSFRLSFTLPSGVSGTHRIIAAGPPTSTNPNRAEATIHIGPCATATPTPPTSAPPTAPPSTPVAVPPSPPPPAITGLDIFGLVALGVVLLGIGGAFIYFGRRRGKSAA